MVDPQHLARAILKSRNMSREPREEEIAMIRVALTHDPVPKRLSQLLATMGDSNRFDFSVDFGLLGHLDATVEELGDHDLDEFVRRWAS